MKRFTILFILINLFFASFYLDSWHNANTTSRVLPVLNYVEKHTIQIDEYADQTMDKSFVHGHYYSDKAPLPSFVIIPFYWTLRAIGLTTYNSNFDIYSRPVFLLGSFICGSLPFVLICFIFFKYAYKYANMKHAALLSMVFLYTSFVFIFSGTFFTHVFSAALLLLSYICIKEKRYFYSGLFLGFAFLSDYTVLFIIPIWAIQIFINEKNFKTVIAFAVGLLPLALLFLLYNKITTGSAFDLLYNHSTFGDGAAPAANLGFSHPSIKALYGLTISPYRGILIYCPMLIFTLVYYFKDKGWSTFQWQKNYLIYITIGYFLLISSHLVWWGGWSYGPRQLMPIAVLLLFEAVLFIAKRDINKVWFWAVSIVTLLFTLMIKGTVVYSVPTEMTSPFRDYFFQNARYGLTNPNNILTMYMPVSPTIAAIVWLFLFGSILFWLNKKLKKV